MDAADLPDRIMGPEGLRPGETIIRSERPSIRLMFGEMLQAATVFGLTLLIPAPFVDPAHAFQPTVAGGAAAFAFALEFVYFAQRILSAGIQVACTRYTLTTDRLSARTRFLSTDLKVVPFEKMTLLRVRRTLFDKILGVAEFDVRAYGAREGRIRLRGLRDPLPFYHATRERIRSHHSAEAILRSD